MANTRLVTPMRAGALMGTAAFALLSATGAHAAGDADGRCPVMATAGGVQVMVSKSDDLFLAAPSGMATPVAQACVDYGLSESTAFASGPYPGETVVSAPPLLRGLTSVPVPDYPVYASSQFPSAQDSRVEQQGLTLRSRSAETSSEATARNGAEPEGGSVAAKAKAVADVDPEGRATVATATSDTQPFTVNEVLRLGQTHSFAQSKVGPDGVLRRESRLTIGHTEVAGQTVEITPDGLRGAGQPVALPEDSAVEALEAAGIQVRYLKAEETPRGILSAGIEITAENQDPQSGATSRVHYTVGRSFAAAAPVADRGGASEDEVPAIDTDAGIAVSGDDDGGTRRPIDVGVADTGPVGPEAPAPVVDAEDLPTAVDPPPPAVAQETRLVGKPLDLALTGLYLAFVIAAMALVVGGTLLRMLGVRTQ